MNGKQRLVRAVAGCVSGLSIVQCLARYAYCDCVWCPSSKRIEQTKSQFPQPVDPRFSVSSIRYHFRQGLSFLAILTLYCLGAGAVASAQAGSWNSIGPTGTYVRVVKIDPVSTTTVYAGLVADGHPLAGVYKSIDGGNTWNAANNGLPDLSAIYALEIDPSNPSTLYAGIDAYYWVGGGVYKSTDGGNSWNATSLPTSWGVYSIAVNPAVPSTIYAGTDGWGLFKSMDGGTNWVDANNGLPLQAVVRSLAINPQTPSTLYAGTQDGGLFQSVDGGSTWSGANTGLPTGATIGAIAINRLTPSTLYAGVDGSAAGPGGGVFISTDGGNTWNDANNGLPTDAGVHTITIDPVNQSNIYTGSFGNGVFISRNGGNTWNDFNQGLWDGLVHSIAVNPQTPTTLYAGTCNSGVFVIQ